MTSQKKNYCWCCLTQKLIDTLNYFWEFSEKNGYMPSYRDAGLHFKITHTAIEHRMWTLEKLGYIQREHKKPRVLTFLKDRRSWRPTGKDEILRLQTETGYESMGMSKDGKYQ